MCNVYQKTTNIHIQSHQCLNHQKSTRITFKVGSVLEIDRLSENGLFRCPFRKFQHWRSYGSNVIPLRETLNPNVESTPKILESIVEVEISHNNPVDTHCNLTRTITLNTWIFPDIHLGSKHVTLPFLLGPVSLKQQFEKHWAGQEDQRSPQDV